SFARPAIALLAMADLSLPSFAGRSKRIGFTLALARCAAICAPITPAPSTAAWRTSIRLPAASPGRCAGDVLLLLGERVASVMGCLRRDSNERLNSTRFCEASGLECGHETP